jgi:hypothetical protein
MRTYCKSNTLLLAMLAVAISMVAVRCTKEGVNAGNVSRALVDRPDSTVFSQFGDSTKVVNADVVADVNDVVKQEGVQTLINRYCASANCHGGRIEPMLDSYESIMTMVTPGNPEGSMLFELITTSDLNKAMPPITYGADMSITEKTKIYNWIKNGAKRSPGLEDYRPTAVSLLTNGCSSANCHNQASLGGNWARRSSISIAPTDTVNFTFVQPGGTVSNISQLKEPKLSEVWNAYKDSVRKFYADTVANASFRPIKIMNTPSTPSNTRAPLNTYDDLLLMVIYPKSVRSNTSIVYTDPVSGKAYRVRGDYLNASSSVLSRVDSTIILANPRTGVYNTTHQGAMAYDDGGLSPSEIAIIKGWYFLDPNIPEVWKYGIGNAGIFKYRKTGNIIKK